MNVDYKINHNPIEILSGTSNITSPLYVEAAKVVNGNDKSLGHLKKFIISMENIASKAGSDSRISKSRGNITKISKYRDIKDGLSFLKKYFGGLGIVKNLQYIHDSLISYTNQYSDGYDKQVRLIVLEYESAAYLLITGLAHTIANNVDVKQTGMKITIGKKNGSDKGIIVKSINDMATKLKQSNHKEYLEALIDAKNSKPIRNDISVRKTDDKKANDTEDIKESVDYIIEASIVDTIEILSSISFGIGKVAGITAKLFSTIKRTAFGIIPLIRTVLYLRYKKKADTVLALEQQMSFIRMNIDQLENIKSMDDKKKTGIIKRQEAIIEGFRKRSEKLRAELSETEKEVETAVSSDNASIKKAPINDDLILD